MKLVFMRKIFILSTFVLVMFSSLVVTDLLANTSDNPDDTVDGVLTTQNFNNEALITNFDMVKGDGSAFDGSAVAMDPFTEYQMKVTVLDPDTIRDLRSVELRFYYETVTDSALFVTNFGDHQSSRPTGLNGTAFTVRWENPVDGTPESNFSIVSSSGITLTDITWDLIEATSAVPQTSAQLNRTTFEFIVHFKVSKVATFSTNSWYVGAIIEDGRVSLDNTLRGTQDPNTVYPALKEGTTQIEADNSDTSFDLSTHATAFDMNFYGEIVKPANTVSVEWDNVPAGVTFGAVEAKSLIEGIIFISNGKYETQIKSSEDWNAMMTSSLADTLFSLVTTSEWDAFDSALTTIGLAPLGQGNLNLQGFKNLNLTFAEVNTVAIAASSTNNFWDTFMGPNDTLGILLPESSPTANRTGAKLIQDATNVSNTAFQDINGLEQYFAIAYTLVDSNDSSVTTIQSATSSGDYDSYYLIGHSNFRSIQEESSFDRNQTLESGHDVDFALYLALSGIFQNARYQGTLTLKIVNQ